MRVRASATTISWIPSEAIDGMPRLPFDRGIAHYDEPPPDRIDDGLATLEALRDADRFRFANHLDVSVDFDDDGTATGWTSNGGGMIGSTTVKIGKRRRTFQATSLPDITEEPETGAGWARFTQVCGGRTGLPAPRRVAHPPFVQFRAPLAWTTLALTVRQDEAHEVELAGASPFPRHWVYGHDGALLLKSGIVDFEDWYRHAFGRHSPWGDEDSPVLAAAVATALEQQLSTEVMHGGVTPRVAAYATDDQVLVQGEEGDEVGLVLDGVVGVAVDGNDLAELGPGAVLGERAVLEGGRRTSTVTARTPVKVAWVPGSALDADSLTELAAGHRREHGTETE